MVFIFSFLGGAIYGSFLNMLLWRLPRREGIMGRSHCTSCDKTIAWYDLIPVLSFFLLSGKCRHCKKTISLRYLIVEIVCGITLAGFAYTSGFYNPHSGALIAAVLIFLSLLFFDLYFFVLPDIITFPAIIGFFAYNVLTHTGFNPFLSGLLYALFFGMIYMVSRGRWLGFGDVKLVLLIGLIFGYPLGFMVIVGGIWIGAGVAIVLLASRKTALGKALPLGSFLSIAAILAIIFQYEIQYLERFFW